MAEWQWKRWDVMQRVMTQKLTMAQASEILRLSMPQVRRPQRRSETVGKPSCTNRRPVAGRIG